MEAAIHAFGERQQQLLRLLLRERDGLTIEAIAARLEVTRTAVKQHLTALERDSYVCRGAQKPTSGRPSRVYLITSKGIALFPKQYSWFSLLMLNKVASQMPPEGLTSYFHEMAIAVAASLKDRLQNTEFVARTEKIAAILTELGYEATATGSGNERTIEASNCVYHDLAMENPVVCEFDRELLRELSGSQLEHEECMARGGRCCRFRFRPSALTSEVDR